MRGAGEGWTLGGVMFVFQLDVLPLAAGDFTNIDYTNLSDNIQKVTIDNHRVHRGHREWNLMQYLCPLLFVLN